MLEFISSFYLLLQILCWHSRSFHSNDFSEADWLIVGLWDSPVVLEAGRVVTVKDVPPAVDVNNTRGHRDKQHQYELDHVTNLNEHGGGHQCQNRNIAVIFGICQATFRARPGGGKRGRDQCGTGRVFASIHTTQLKDQRDDM